MRSVKFKNFRDDVARVIAAWVLDNIATDEYGQRIADLIEVGLEQERKKAEAPTVDVVWTDRRGA